MKKNMAHGSVYIDKGLWKEAKKKGINISHVLREALQEIVAQDECPTCGHKKEKQNPKVKALTKD